MYKVIVSTTRALPEGLPAPAEHRDEPPTRCHRIHTWLRDTKGQAEALRERLARHGFEASVRGAFRQGAL